MAWYILHYAFESRPAVLLQSYSCCRESRIDDTLLYAGGSRASVSMLELCSSYMRNSEQDQKRMLEVHDG